MDCIGPIWEKLKKLFGSLWNVIKDLYEALKPIFELIGGLVIALGGIVSGVLDGVISALGPWLESILDVANAVCEIIQFVCAILRGDWEDAWTHMQNVGLDLWSSIKNLFQGIWEFFKGFGEGFVSFFEGIGINIKNIFSKVWSGITGFFSNVGSGLSSMCGSIWDRITGLFGNIGNFFSNKCSDAFNWGKNLISNIADGINKAWNWVVDGVKSIGKAIADFLGFGSPTKKGPGHTADEWIPNLLEMMETDFEKGQPDIQRAAASVASALNITGAASAVVSTGESPYGDMVNGLLQGMTAMRNTQQTEETEIVLEIDGQRFARLIAPKLARLYKQNGIVLKGV